jgi:hypothetical protein
MGRFLYRYSSEQATVRRKVLKLEAKESSHALYKTFGPKYRDLIGIKL